MVSRSILAKHGCTPEAWRKLLETPEGGDPGLSPSEETESDDPLKTQGAKLDRLRRRVRSRIRTGIDYNLTNYKTCYALDLIWNSPFRQLNPTFVATLAKRYTTEEQLTSAMTALGLDLGEVFMDTEQVDPKTKLPIKAVNIPTFFAVTVPLVRAYLQIRRAKLINDRNVDPLIKYESAVNTAEQRVKCEILTSRIKVMAKQYDYLGALNQSVFQMLLYGTCLQFTREEWHFEEQLKYAEEEDVKRWNAREKELKTKKPKEADEPDTETKNTKEKLAIGEEMVYTVREGLRYYHPHPSRTFWDMAHCPRTFNTDTGCDFAGHWQVVRWKEIRDNPDFFNKDRIGWGQGDPWWTAFPTSGRNFFNAVYNGCVLNFPQPPAPPEGVDREAWVAQNRTYGESHGDHAIVYTEYREKLIPKNEGLGDYPHPIWVRFCVAGDGTIIYAAPMCYRPVVCFRDNGDDRMVEDASLGLQLAPHQDMLSNLLTQFLYSVKQNLTNFTLIDENVMPKGWIEKLRNLGEKWIRGINIIPFDSKAWSRKQIDPAKNTAFYSHRFPPMDTSAILNAMKVVIDMAERVLQFSAQEVAQAASHEQTKAEIDVIKGSTTTILQYTGLQVDNGLEAQAVQLYEALMNWGDDDFFAYIPSDHDLSKESLETMGITVIAGTSQKDKRILVRSKKSALMFWFFGIAPNFLERRNDMDAARMISELVRDWFINNQMGQSALGPDQLVELTNYIAKLAGMPLERPIRNAGLTTQEQNQAAQQQLRAMIDQVLVDVKKGLIPIMEQNAQQEKQIAGLYQQMGIPMPDANGTDPSGNGHPPQPGGAAEAPEMAGASRIPPA